MHAVDTMAANDSDRVLVAVSWLTSTVLIIVTASWLNRLRKKQARKAELQTWVAAARASRDEKEPKCLSLHMNETPLYTASADATRKLILTKMLNPAANVVTLAKRCRLYGRDQKGVNAITEEFYDEAYETATSLKTFDDEKDAPPLYGVPLSVKDCINLEGAFSTGGMACRLGRRCSKDSLIVQLVREAGALPLCRGNVPQIMMLPETFNLIYGRTCNPWDLTRTTGGSSGGDAALVAMKCVPLAIASDVAGSIRIPASMCGIVGFKPTSTRLSGKGCMKPRKDNRLGTSVAIPATVGPLARTVEDCANFMKAVCVPTLFEQDRNVPPMPFDEKAYNEKGPLTIGYFETDGWFEPCATAKRALRETIDALRKAGHTCVPFEPPTDGWYNYGLLVSINAAEGNMRSYVEALEGEDMISEYDTLRKAANLPNWIRFLVRMVIDKRRSHLLGCTSSGGVSVWQLWQYTADLLSMRTVWSDAVQKAGVDAILHPPLPVPAMPHGVSGKVTAAISYLFLANMLLWPSGTVPVTVVQPGEQFYNATGRKKDFYDKMATQIMEGSAGLPMGVAVMTTAFQDEKCLRVMKEVERVMPFREEPEAYKQQEI